MKSTKRALRRHHRRRMLLRALRSLALSWPEYEDAECRRQRALRLRDNLKKCSCFMCGNRRRHVGPTIQEKREFLTATSDSGIDASISTVDAEVETLRLLWG